MTMTNDHGKGPGPGGPQQRTTDHEQVTAALRSWPGSMAGFDGPGAGYTGVFLFRGRGRLVGHRRVKKFVKNGYIQKNLLPGS